MTRHHNHHATVKCRVDRRNASDARQTHRAPAVHHTARLCSSCCQNGPPLAGGMPRGGGAPGAPYRVACRPRAGRVSSSRSRTACPQTRSARTGGGRRAAPPVTGRRHSSAVTPGQVTGHWHTETATSLPRLQLRLQCAVSGQTVVHPHHLHLQHAPAFTVIIPVTVITNFNVAAPTPLCSGTEHAVNVWYNTVTVQPRKAVVPPPARHRSPSPMTSFTPCT